jgi:hypothetical protein
MTSQKSLADRDLKIAHIENEIKNRQKLLLEKRQQLEERKKENHFLEMVTKDYQKYYDYVINEKKQQIQSLVILNTYLENLIKTEKMTDHEIQDAQNEKKNILKELDKIKEELDSLVS